MQRDSATKQKQAMTIDQPVISKPTASETTAEPATTTPANFTNTTALTPPRHSDGFDSVIDAVGHESLIKGNGKVRFTNNAEWLDPALDVVSPTREFLVLEIVKAAQKFLLKDGKWHVETRILAPDEFFPDKEKRRGITGRKARGVRQDSWTL
jgi:hypothetical protein